MATFSSGGKSRYGYPRRYRPGRIPPTRPPSGTYDPVLDQGLAAAGRGLGDLKLDTERDNSRAANDYSIATNRSQQQTGYGLADLLRNQTREQQDYGLGTQAVDRRYGQLADAQRQQGNAAGLLGGGYAQAAARKRAANQQLDQSQLDLAHGRTVQDINTSRDRVTTAGQQDLAGLGLQYQRGNEDRNTTLTRATREYNQYGLDVGESRFFAAKDSGWTPPTGLGRTVTDLFGRKRFRPVGRKVR
jgi:hypothetical protein